MSDIKKLAEAGNGSLYEKNSFLIPVLTGSPKEMGAQYGALMKDHMQKTFDTIIEPGWKTGRINDKIAQEWTERAYSTGSIRNRLFYDGVAEGSGWSLNKVGLLDNFMELSIYQTKLFDTFAGCTSIAAWGTYATDNGMYIGRNQDWSATFNKFPTVLTIRRPTDGSNKYAAVGWPGIVFPLTAINEHGAYLDIHDGTSMGGSIVFTDRMPVTQVLSDLMAETNSLPAMVRRLNTISTSISIILTLADAETAGSMECSAPGGNRYRKADGDALVTVNTHLIDDWGMGQRDSVSYSLERFANMTNRLKENKGKIDAQATRNLMDLRLYDADGNVLPDGGCTKPINQDVDVTVYQAFTDVKRKEMSLKIPVPDYFVDWTPFDLNELWN